jgi:hypothetical protein
MSILNTRVIYAVLFYVLLIILIVLSKPSMIFDPKDGHLKPFGIGYDKTLFSLGVFTVVLAIISFYIFCLIDLVFASK